MELVADPKSYLSAESAPKSWVRFQRPPGLNSVLYHTLGFAVPPLRGSGKVVNRYLFNSSRRSKM